MIGIVLIDDHLLVRQGYQLMMAGASDMQVLGTASTALQGLQLIRSLHPDVAVVDVCLPDMSGIELTERIRRSGLKVSVVIATMLADRRLPRRLLNVGATGYVTKECSQEELLSAIRLAARGRRYLAATVAQEVALASLGDSCSPFDRLSRRELEVAMMLAKGQTLSAIADQLSLSPKTVSTHKQRLLDKLELDNVVGLARLMSAYGVLDVTPGPGQGEP
ncbi:response regulator [Frateuria aurantia]|uniref:Response regulator containing a CheY-like receiver domain and an HTH DNA-binding domain n=1 Tax=Frateuria aurantia (strain ATCC 33424 / DSM 6220 / KCTC 2777 / LMG 1558 / NBRC 3245 / NCIMB 13370) TaxID=767434 RepID=H8L1P7_FRAAD|nr:response regulator transcription factor [Frateuria aurantia]AFC85407.1 response regulator containing a CheY-like receiver domain and an HTH DNA-binding domain [Frateuria aurantia DSM 6220]